MSADPRPPAYFDSSALVKRYVAESGSDAARGLLLKHRVLSSRLTPLEITSAVRRRQRERQLSQAQLADILEALQHDRLHWELTDVDREILRRAEALLRSTTVRTVDAIHICAAAAARTALGDALPFVTADRQQRAAAETAGLDVTWVE